jgi:hypothetical protein
LSPPSASIRVEGPLQTLLCSYTTVQHSQNQPSQPKGQTTGEQEQTNKTQNLELQDPLLLLEELQGPLLLELEDPLLALQGPLLTASQPQGALEDPLLAILQRNPQFLLCLFCLFCCQVYPQAPASVADQRNARC